MEKGLVLAIPFLLTLYEATTRLAQILEQSAAYAFLFSYSLTLTSSVKELVSNIFPESDDSENSTQTLVSRPSIFSSVRFLFAFLPPLQVFFADGLMAGTGKISSKAFPDDEIFAVETSLDGVSCLMTEF